MVVFKYRLMPNFAIEIYMGNCREKILKPEASSLDKIKNKKDSMLSVTGIILSFLKGSARVKQILFKHELFIILSQESANLSCNGKPCEPNIL